MSNKDEINKIIYQSWHRGCKETDIILGDFAKSNVPSFDDKKLGLYKKLISEDDWDIYNWFVGRDKTPTEYQILIEEIKDFSQNKFNS